MYPPHFGLREAPFGLTPDTSYYLESLAHGEALNVLLAALRSGEGFTKIVGEVGTGKTRLCRQLLRVLDDAWITADLPNSLLTPRSLPRAVERQKDPVLGQANLPW